VHATGDRIAAIASAVATRYPYWAVVGSGPIGSPRRSPGTPRTVGSAHAGLSVR
jgi:hypothetical protein